MNNNNLPLLPPLTDADIEYALISQRKRFKPSREQVVILESYFESRVFLRPNDAEELSKTLKVPVKTIRLWFQNRRAKERRKIQMKNAIQMKHEMFAAAGYSHNNHSEPYMHHGEELESGLTSPNLQSPELISSTTPMPTYSRADSPDPVYNSLPKPNTPVETIPTMIPAQQDNQERPTRTQDCMKLSNLLD